MNERQIHGPRPPWDQSELPPSAVLIHGYVRRPWNPGIHERSATNI